MKTYQIGVLADSFASELSPVLAGGLTAVFETCDVIFHLGNVTGEGFLRDLGRIAPVITVRGEQDKLALPRQTLVSIAGLNMVLTHAGASPYQDLQGVIAGKLSGSRSEAWQKFLDSLVQASPGVDAILFGHGNRPYMAWHGNTLLFSPGAFFHQSQGTDADPLPTVGLLTISGGKLQAEMRSLAAPEEPPASAVV
jgi:predicted phosphodiesterase